MPAVITSKAKNGLVTVVFNSSGYISLNAASAFGANNAGETVQRMSIVKISQNLSGSANASIQRGANLVFRCVPGQHTFDFSGDNTPLEASAGDRSANLVVTMAGAGGGTVIVQLKKQSATSTYS